jgi:prepilin-type N-terminal cleavage/methylation domain-containing protein
MWSTRRGASTSSGFSLIEALIALAIAAFLAAVLTRFVTSTRANALHVRQEVVLDILSDSLLERLGSRELQPGRTDGRNGMLRWYIDVAPITFSAHALSVAEEKPVNSAARINAPGSVPAVGPVGSLGASAVGSSGTSTDSAPGWAVGLLPLLTNSNQETTGTTPRVVWNPYLVTAVINSPSGESYAVDTVRLGGQRSEKPSEQAAAR